MRTAPHHIALKFEVLSSLRLIRAMCRPLLDIEHSMVAVISVHVACCAAGV